jgi:hypothetical protein
MIFISITTDQQVTGTSNVGRKSTNFNIKLTKCGVFPHFFPEILMRSIHSLIRDRGPLAQLKRQLSAQQALASQVAKLLPSPLNEQLQGAVLSGRRLALLVNSPVWASRLRYLAPQLARQLRQRGLPVEQVVPRIVPEERKTTSGRPSRSISLSKKNAQMLRQTAESLESGPLQDALRRLSRHG